MNNIPRFIIALMLLTPFAAAEEVVWRHSWKQAPVEKIVTAGEIVADASLGLLRPSRKRTPL